MNAPTFSRLFAAVRRWLLLSTALAVVAAAQASSPPPAAPSGPFTAADSAIRITLLTVGQGDQVYEMFGHNAIWVHDPAAGVDSVYNWGVFDFRSEGFIARFLQGDMRYTMAAESIENTIAYYQYFNRRMWAQELDLTPGEKRAIVDYIRWNSRPENRQYRYNYYLDNCSTRVRDIIDRALGGRLRAYLSGIQTDQSYRDHSLRLMQSAPLLVTGVDVALGRNTDFPLTADQASFLPVQLMQYVSDFRREGDARPLVAREYVLNQVARPAEPANVPALWKGLVPIGVLLGALVFGLWAGLRARRSTAALTAVVAGVIGIVGMILFLLVTITDHVAAHANENLWMINPVWLVIAVVVPRAMITGRWTAVARWAAGIGAALGLCAVLMHLVGLSRQPNWDVIGLVLPFQLAVAAIALRYRDSRRLS